MKQNNIGGSACEPPILSYFSFQKIFLNPSRSTANFSHKCFIQDAVSLYCSVAGCTLRHDSSVALSSNRPESVCLAFLSFFF